MVLNKISKEKMGLWGAFINVLPYSIIPLIFLIQYSDLTGGSDLGRSLAMGAINAAAKDFVSVIVFVGLVFIRGRFQQHKELFMSKSGLYLVLSGIFGGPLGYTAFNAAFYLAGAGYSHIFSSLEPIMLICFSYLFMKRKFRWQVVLGVSLTVAGVISTIAGTSMGSHQVSRVILGSFLAIVGALAWTIESILVDKAFSMRKDIDVMDAMSVKMPIAVLFSIIVIFPIFGAIHSEAANSYKAFGSLFTNTNYLWRFILVGFLIVIGRGLFFYGMNTIGATLSGILYEISIVLTPIFQLLWYGMTKDMPGIDVSLVSDHLTLQYQLVFWLSSALIVSGVIVATIYRTKINRKKEYKEYIKVV